MTLAKKSLRKMAEKKIAEGDVPLKAMTIGEMSALIEELQIHQVELELQNEELRKSQEETEKARKTYWDLWEFSPVGYLIIDGKGRIEAFNCSAQRLFGAPENTLLNERFTRFLAIDDQVTVQLLLERARTAEISETHEVRLLTQDGLVCICKLFCRAFTEESKGQNIQIVLTNITEQKQAIEALRKTREELQSEREELERRVRERTAAMESQAVVQRGINRLLLEEVERRKQYESELKEQGEKLLREIRRRAFLSKKLVTLLERERMEISGALHDEIGQVLTTIQMDLDVLKKLGPEDLDRLKTEIAKSQKTIRKAMGLVRKIGHQIRPDILEHLGLVPAVENLIQMVQDRSNIKVHFFTKGVAKNLEDNKSLAVYRIIQESLTNALKYSEAKNIFINLIRKGKTLRVNVEDDGIGFNSAELFEGDGNLASLGITIMHERAVLVGGELHVESEVGKGTQVMADIPAG